MLSFKFHHGMAFKNQVLAFRSRLDHAPMILVFYAPRGMLGKYTAWAHGLYAFKFGGAKL